jgi:hypothetical protein
VKTSVFIENYVMQLKHKIDKLENKIQQAECEDCPYLDRGYVCECEHTTPNTKILDKLKAELTKFYNYK